MEEFLGCEDTTCGVFDDGEVISKCRHLYAGNYFQCQLFNKDLWERDEKDVPLRLKSCLALEKRSSKLKVVRK